MNDELESVAFFYIPDPPREPPCVEKKSRGFFKKRSHVPIPPALFQSRPKRARKTFLLIHTRNHTRNHEWPRNVALGVPIHSLSLPFSKIILIRRPKLFRPVYNACSRPGQQE